MQQAKSHPGSPDHRANTRRPHHGSATCRHDTSLLPTPYPCQSNKYQSWPNSTQKSQASFSPRPPDPLCSASASGRHSTNPPPRHRRTKHTSPLSKRPSHWATHTSTGAEVYNTESELGAAIKASKHPRDKLF